MFKILTIIILLSKVCVASHDSELENFGLPDDRGSYDKSRLSVYIPERHVTFKSKIEYIAPIELQEMPRSSSSLSGSKNSRQTVYIREHEKSSSSLRSSLLSQDEGAEVQQIGCWERFTNCLRSLCP